MIDTYSKNILEQEIPSNSAIGIDTDIFGRIHQKDTSITIYKRNIDFLEKEIQLLLEHKIEFQSNGNIDTIEKELKQTLNSYDVTLIFEDIIHLLRSFERVSEVSEFRLLLTIVDSNMCRKFHTDINTLRMLCTYCGPGTLWLSGKTTKSKTFQEQIKNDEIRIEENLINQVDTGHAVILKGALYPMGSPIIHRSPSIEKTGKKRLLLRIDLNENPWT